MEEKITAVLSHIFHPKPIKFMCFHQCKVKVERGEDVTLKFVSAVDLIRLRMFVLSTLSSIYLYIDKNKVGFFLC